MKFPGPLKHVRTLDKECLAILSQAEEAQEGQEAPGAVVCGTRFDEVVYLVKQIFAGVCCEGTRASGWFIGKPDRSKTLDTYLGSGP